MAHVELSEFLKRRRQDWPSYVRYEEACNARAQAQAQAHEAASRAEWKRQKETEQQKRRELAWWQSLSGSQFETELAALFRSRGMAVRRRGGSGDGGVDLEVMTENKRILVQCKALGKYVSPGAVRELYGTLLHEKADEAWLVATRGFHEGSRAFAEGKAIRLLTIEEVLSNIYSASSDP